MCVCVKVGGRFGLDLRQSQPASTVVAATLIGQSCAAVLYEGFEVLTMVGARIQDFRSGGGWSLVRRDSG